jgi:hypothetical protein
MVNSQFGYLENLLNIGDVGKGSAHSAVLAYA